MLYRIAAQQIQLFFARCETESKMRGFGYKLKVSLGKWLQIGFFVGGVMAKNEARISS
jgi:hypothetical protein